MQTKVKILTTVHHENYTASRKNNESIVNHKYVDGKLENSNFAAYNLPFTFKYDRTRL